MEDKEAGAPGFRITQVKSGGTLKEGPKNRGFFYGLNSRGFMASVIEDKVTELAKPLIESLGLELWGVKCRGSSSRLRLQVFIESQEGISADTCADVSRVLSPALDAADLIDDAYVLEVSSPGLDRMIFNLEQLGNYLGKEVRLELRIPVNNRKRFSGRVSEIVDDANLIFDDKDEGRLEISWHNVHSCRVVPDFS